MSASTADSGRAGRDARLGWPGDESPPCTAGLLLTVTGHVWPAGGTDTKPGLHWIIDELFRDSAARLGWLAPPPGKRGKGKS